MSDRARIVGDMDPFDELLRGVRTEGAGVERRELTPPWTLRGTESLTLYAPLAGEGWLSDGDSAPRPVRVGETAVVRGPAVFTAGPEPADRTVLLVGTYHLRGEVSRRLLDALPPALVVPDGDDCAPLRDFLEAQFAACLPGRQVVLDRLLDWLLVCTLRDWFGRPEATTPGWYRALSDDTVGPALRAMHAAPDKPWTLAALAREARVSRTTLAKRFAALVGEPPLTYLTNWRMTLAADLLTESTATVAKVAHQVGYADAFGFSAAFKRRYGMSPSECRRTECSATG
jgi:AraC-like DNA-binding protein